MIIRAKRVYLCCGNKTGVPDPEKWVGVDLDPLLADVVADVREIERVDADWIFATPPCGSFTDLPWRRATNRDLDVLEACLRLCQMARRGWLLECNRFAQRFLGPAEFTRGPHYFWGNAWLLVGQFTHRKSAQSGRYPLRRAAIPPVLYFLEEEARE
jgi:hypothetical protein